MNVIKKIMVITSGGGTSIIGASGEDMRVEMGQMGEHLVLTLWAKGVIVAQYFDPQAWSVNPGGE